MIGRSGPSLVGDLVASRGVVADDHEGWLAESLRIGELQSTLFMKLSSEGRHGIARTVGMSALTTLRAAAHLLGDHDARRDDVAAKLQACARNVLRYADLSAEVVALPGADRAPLRAWFLPSPGARDRAPVVICLGDEGETLDMLFSRVAPAATGKGAALFLIEMSEIEDAPGLHHAGLVTAEMRLADCIDYLASRGDVDDTNIAVWGDGLAGAIATRLAISDERVRAAVCDGGLWDALRIDAGVAWLADGEGAAARPGDSVRWSRLARRIQCPFLVVASERNVASVEEAAALHAECLRLGVPMELEVPPAASTPRLAAEAMLRGEGRIADWLLARLGEAVRLTAGAEDLPRLRAGRD